MAEKKNDIENKSSYIQEKDNKREESINPAVMASESNILISSNLIQKVQKRFKPKNVHFALCDKTVFKNSQLESEGLVIFCRNQGYYYYYYYLSLVLLISV